MFNIKDELKKLPALPGVYIMRDGDDKILYVGKAKNLKNRVRQYFQESANHMPHIKAMIAKIARFEYIITDSELEALILECNLIKKNKPRYNVVLKDDKMYPYIKVTLNEDYPRIFMARKVLSDNAKYYGPYSNSKDVNATIDVIKSVFPMKNCAKVLPRDINKTRPCLNFFIGKCLAPCTGDIKKEKYRAMIKDVCAFLDGREHEIIAKLEKSMKEAAEQEDFEGAAVYRDKINSIKSILVKQKVFSASLKDRDVIGFEREGNDCCMQVFHIRGGKLTGSECYPVENTEDIPDQEVLSAFIKQLYGKSENIPGEILLQTDIDDREIINIWLNEKRGGSVKINIPQKGEQAKLVEMAKNNAKDALRQFKDRTVKNDEFLNQVFSEMNELLGFDKFPERIEAYDISNTGQSEITGAMSVVADGKLVPKEYKRFKIKGIDIQDDYAATKQMLSRRLAYLTEDKGSVDGELSGKKSDNREPSGKESGFHTPPSLILADGGKGHVNAICDVLEDMKTEEAAGAAIPVFGMVKDDKHRTKGLADKNGNIIHLKNHPALFRFITQIQDETHRFALDYNKKLRKKRYEKSILDEIPGVGPKKKKALIKHFGNINVIKKAGIDDLCAVDGVNENLARAIYLYLHQQT